MRTKQSFLHNNSLSIVLLFFFLLFLLGQGIAGFYEHNDFLRENQQPTLTAFSYLKSGHFMQATFENWESEFLQMFIYVVLTIFLRQKGSSESKPLNKHVPVDRQPVAHKDAPWPVKKGGFILFLYKTSLSIAFFLLFFISFAAHAYGSYKSYRAEQKILGKPLEHFTEYLKGSRFWFESFQNWQSEFLAVFSIVVLSIFLRQYGSPESKPVDAAHKENS